MNVEWSTAEAPSARDVRRLAEAAMEALPAAYARAAREVALRVEELAPEPLLAEMEIDDPFDLTGLYEGVPLTEKSVSDQPMGPDTIWLFRRPILDEWVARGDVTLGALVGHVLVHELAHHFGWSDGEIARIDRWWE